MSLQDLTDRDAVVQAAREFDAIGRDAFLEKYGFSPSRKYFLVLDDHVYDSKSIVGAAHGFQHPRLGPLPHTEFNGGEQTTSKLRSLGFTVEERNGQVEDAGEHTGELLAAFLQRYATAKNETFGGGHEAALLLKRAGHRIESTLPAQLSGARVRPSVGQGNWAAVPWIAILDPRVTTTTQEGVYPVVLIREDLAGLYVTIAQGVTKLKREGGQRQAYEALRRRAAELRPHMASLDGRGFSDGHEVFLGGSTLARDYAVSTVVSKYFSRADLEDADVENDLAAVNRVYAALVDQGIVGVTPRSSQAATPRVLAIYVGERARANFESGGRQGWWGWKRAPDDASRVSVGDLIIFASGYTGGSPRVEQSGWQQHELRQLVIGRIDKPTFRTDEAIMPDELSGQAEYPWKIRFTILGEEHGVTLHPGDQLSGATVEALRLSAINQGRGELSPLKGSPMLKRYLTEPELPGSTTPADVAALASEFGRLVEASGMRLDRDQITAFLAAVLAKPFAILTGQSGSGKTQLAKRLGEWCGQDAHGRPRYLVVPVRPDWTGPEYLFGYPDGLAPRIDDQVVWAVPETLEFLLRAQREPAAPFVLVLDEMNLAHVERYFADFLSGIESREPVMPDLAQRDGRWTEPRIGRRLPLPSNVIVIGTVNVDETTYMFSPKVLDRAFVHEFRVASDDLDPRLGRPSALPAADEETQRHIVRLLQDDSWHIGEPHPAQDALVEELRGLHRHLSRVNLDFGHRTFFEALRFASLAHSAGLGSSDSVLDYLLMTKLLPKVHGSRQRLDLSLSVLLVLAKGTDAEEETASEWRLPRSAAKLERMLQVLRDAQFVTFTE